MIPGERLRQIRERLAYVEARLADGASGGDIAALGREHAELVPVVERIAAWEALRAEIAETETMQRDAEMRALAEEELPRLRARLEAEEAALMRALLPRDRDDDRSAILEIRAGTGGEEAALFAADLFRMYQRYAEARGWRFDILDETLTELGGVKEVVARISGENVFARMKFESGVHRVQRVPATESGGRIHTSAATVAVLPEASDVDIDVDPGDGDLAVEVEDQGVAVPLATRARTRRHQQRRARARYHQALSGEQGARSPSNLLHLPHR